MVVRVSQPATLRTGSLESSFVISSSIRWTSYNFLSVPCSKQKGCTRAFAAFLWNKGRKSRNCAAENAGFMTFL